MVNRFLESKGIQLPLTHHHLAEMKHEAGVSGYAVGSKGLKKKKPKKAKKKEPKEKAPLINQSVNVTVTSGSKSSASASGGGGSGSGGAGGKGTGGGGGRGGGGGLGGGGGGGDKARALYNQLRPNNYAMIRSVSLAPQQIYPVIDYGKEAREAKAKESETLEHYKKEIETRKKQMEQLETTMADVLKAKEPLQRAESSVPLRANDFEQFSPDFIQRERMRAIERHMDREAVQIAREAKKVAKKKEKEEKKVPSATQEPIAAQPAVAQPAVAQPAVSPPVRRKQQVAPPGDNPYEESNRRYNESQRKL
jgi:hypothetical protein